MLKINPNITQVELSNKLSVSRRTISTLLAHLKERGKIERVGSDRKGYWKLLKWTEQDNRIRWPNMLIRKNNNKESRVKCMRL